MTDESTLRRWRTHFEQFLGEHYHHHPDLPYRSFSPAKDAALREIERYDVNPRQLTAVDTRPTLRAVVGELVKMEHDCTGDAYGPWDEYMTVMPPNSSHVCFPRHYRTLKVYVLHGTNEGYYLHVDITLPQANKHPTAVLARTQLLAGWPADMRHTLDDDLCLFVGKSLGHTWSDCYASSGRIAYVLGA